jgi:raffinose/stachyose/melibiose transport system substrate-binding protein
MQIGATREVRPPSPPASARPRRRAAALAGGLAAAVTLAACGSSGASHGASAGASSGGSTGGGSGGKVTLTWWNNATTGQLLKVWNDAARTFHSMHPNVTIRNVPIQNEELQNTKEPAALQSGNPPQVFQQWGGGREASEVPSGELANLSQSAKSWIGELGSRVSGWQANGQQYGVPYDLHIVGFWYRRDLFRQAGITTPPATLAELESDDAKLKAHHITPIAVGSKDGWPDAFWWEYLALRDCTTQTIQAAMKSASLTAPCFTKAGTQLRSFIATQPFEPGFLGVASQVGAGSSAGLLASGKAAMELQGDWEPGVVQGLTSSKTILSKLGWFPFPSVPGGAGEQKAVLGGGDGFSCSAKAGPACVQFLQYIDSVPVQKQVAKASVGLPANPAASSAITTPGLRTAVDYEKSTPFLQTSFDSALTVSEGQAIDQAIATFFAGQGSPTSIAAAVSSAKTK